MYEQEVSLNQNMLVEREGPIRELEKGVRDVSELFQDISILVSHQGERIDNIETNISNTLNNTEKASLELLKLNKYRQKKRVRCMYAWCFFIMFTIILILVLYLSS